MNWNKFGMIFLQYDVAGMFYQIELPGDIESSRKKFVERISTTHVCAILRNHLVGRVCYLIYWIRLE